MRKVLFKHIKRVVVKIGSGVISNAGGLEPEQVAAIAEDVCSLLDRGLEVILVSSGAVAAGKGQLGIVGRPQTIPQKQAAAAIGQTRIIREYRETFQARHYNVAQVLLTRDDLSNRRRYLNARNTMMTLLDYGVTPIVNENDTVVVEEIKFGDNDTLAALVSLVINAELMLMLTDVDGLFDRNPAEHNDAQRLASVESVDGEVMAMAGDVGSSFGTGGMVSKLKAARVAIRGGVAAAIINGHRADGIADFLKGADIGTLFLCGEDRQSRKQHWIVDLLHPAGTIHVDAGAAGAIVGKGSSLLPIGMTAVEGVFDKGECVEIHGPDGVIARGLCNYTGDEMRRLIGVASDRIESVLGYVDFTSVIHRDNLVLLQPEENN